MLFYDNSEVLVYEIEYISSKYKKVYLDYVQDKDGNLIEVTSKEFAKGRE